MAIFEIALRGVERKKLKILSIIILNAIAIIMIGGILYIKDTNTRSEYLTNNILSNGNENTYVMFIYGKMDSEMLTECNIKNIDCAKSDIGGWEMEGVDELVNLQREIKSNDNNKQTEDFGNYLDNTKRILEVTSIQNIESLELYNLKLQDGKYYSKQEAKDKTVYFYLGSKYKNIKAGTSYKMADGNTAVVAGIFEENQYIIDADGFQGSVSDMLTNIDDKILGFENIDDNNLYGRYLVTFNGNMTSKAAIENMKAIAIENNVSISACTVKDAFEEIYHKENVTLGAFRELPLLLKGVKRKERKKQILEYMEKLGIIKLLKKYPKQLSGGEKQRTAIARAIIAGNDIILADEPTGALDSDNSKNIMELLKEINSQGKTVIIVTHDEQVAKYAKKVFYIKDGREYRP